MHTQLSGGFADDYMAFRIRTIVSAHIFSNQTRAPEMNYGLCLIQPVQRVRFCSIIRLSL
jgi:hypothetical protein